MMLLLFTVWVCHAAGTVLENTCAQQDEIEMRKKISETVDGLKTMQCDFVQTKHIKMLNDKLVSKGRMYYQQGKRLRWDYVTPYSYTFVLNSDKVLLKNKHRHDVVDVGKKKVFNTIVRMMMNSVTGDCLSDGKSFKSSLCVVGNEWVATLLPQLKELKQMFKKITLHFSEKEAMVTQVELLEPNGDKTVIELKNIKKNESIDPNMFSLN